MVDERQHNGSPTALLPGLFLDAGDGTGHRDTTHATQATHATSGLIDSRCLAADGTPRLPHIAYDEDGYPYDDGEPLGQNQQQIAQLLYAAPALQALFEERDQGAFVGCDMFIYPRRHRSGVAPDLFVAFGADASRTDRLSYKLFEGEPVPSFVMEVLSGSTADEDLGPKRNVYARMGIAEYWLFDPVGGDIPGLPDRVAGYRLVEGEYQPIAPLPEGRGCPSGVLGLELRAEGANLRFHDPRTGQDLLLHGEERAGRMAEAAGRKAEAAAREVAEERAAEAEERAAEEVAARQAAEQRAADAEERVAQEAAARKAAEAEIERLRRLYGDDQAAP